MTAAVEAPMLEAALRYIDHGIAIFPCAPGAKHPITPNGVKDATTDAGQVRAWWTQTPDANIGMPMGALNKRIALDIDVKKQGDTTLAALTKQHGEVPSVLVQNTPSGGLHVLFQYDSRVKNTVEKIGPGIDTRSDAGYIIVAPSVIDAKPYTWLGQPYIQNLPAMPEWLIAMSGNRVATNGRVRSDEEWAKVIGGVPQGNRQEELPRVVGLLYAKLGPESARRMAHAYGQSCTPAMSEEEVEECCSRIEARQETKGCATDDPGGERYTDMANAVRIADEAENEACHVYEMKDDWYLFDGVKLALSPKTAMVPYVKRISRRLFEEAEQIEQRAQSAESNEEVERLAKLARLRRSGAVRLESRDGCYAALDLARAEKKVAIRINQLDAHWFWLNTPTGTMDLETGQLHEHRITDYLTKVTRAAYDPKALCPVWKRFLEDVLPDPGVREFMQRSVGYALTDDNREHVIWFLYGTGANGKTTFVNAIRHALGDYAASTKASTLMVKQHGDERRNDIAILRGARLVSATEAEDGQHFAEALVKEITGGDPVTVRLLYKEFTTFTPTFKIWLAANYKPVVRGQDLGIWRRIRLVPFTVTIPEGMRDKSLPQKLEAEANGILAWAIEGYQMWRRNGLKPPTAVTDATAEYRKEMDTLGAFIDDRMVKDDSRRLEAGNLYDAYEEWADENGIRYKLTKQKLGQELRQRGFEQDKGAQGKRLWRGLRLA